MEKLKPYIEKDLQPVIIGGTYPGFDSQFKVNGSYPDITNVVVTMEIRQRPGQSSPILTLSSAGGSPGITKTTPASNLFRLNAFYIDPAIFTKAGTHSFKVVYTYTDGTKKIYIIGTLPVIDA